MIATSIAVEKLAWYGASLGAFVFAAGAAASAGLAVVPSTLARGSIAPDQITGYAIALCGALTVIFNTLLALYQRWGRARLEATAQGRAELKAIARLEAARVRARARRAADRKGTATVDANTAAVDANTAALAKSAADADANHDR